MSSAPAHRAVHKKVMLNTERQCLSSVSSEAGQLTVQCVVWKFLPAERRQSVPDGQATRTAPPSLRTVCT